MAPEKQRKPASERLTPEREPKGRGRATARRKELRTLDDSFEIAPSGVTQADDTRWSDGFRSPPRDDRAG
jgi:hypothetical protein